MFIVVALIRPTPLFPAYGRIYVFRWSELGKEDKIDMNDLMKIPTIKIVIQIRHCLSGRQNEWVFNVSEMICSLQTMWVHVMGAKIYIIHELYHTKCNDSTIQFNSNWCENEIGTNHRMNASYLITAWCVDNFLSLLSFSLSLAFTWIRSLFLRWHCVWCRSHTVHILYETQQVKMIANRKKPFIHVTHSHIGYFSACSDTLHCSSSFFCLLFLSYSSTGFMSCIFHAICVEFYWIQQA